MSHPLPNSDRQDDASTSAADQNSPAPGRSVDVVTQEGMIRKHSHSAAIIIAVGNFLTFVSLRWTQNELLSGVPPPFTGCASDCCFPEQCC
ncbi:MAG TPA: hypothetical protein DCG12_01465 [Planctomycetaceae bacterium]|nr:hypothetical protein [Planctomycetaceae bacterium]